MSTRSAAPSKTRSKLAQMLILRAQSLESLSLEIELPVTCMGVQPSFGNTKNSCSIALLTLILTLGGVQSVQRKIHSSDQDSVLRRILRKNF